MSQIQSYKVNPESLIDSISTPDQQKEAIPAFDPKRDEMFSAALNTAFEGGYYSTSIGEPKAANNQNISSTRQTSAVNSSKESAQTRDSQETGQSNDSKEAPVETQTEGEATASSDEGAQLQFDFLEDAPVLAQESDDGADEVGVRTEKLSSEQSQTTSQNTYQVTEDEGAEDAHQRSTQPQVKEASKEVPKEVKVTPEGKTIQDLENLAGVEKVAVKAEKETMEKPTFNGQKLPIAEGASKVLQQTTQAVEASTTQNNFVQEEEVSISTAAESVDEGEDQVDVRRAENIDRHREARKSEAQDQRALKTQQSPSQNARPSAAPLNPFLIQQNILVGDEAADILNFTSLDESRRVSGEATKRNAQVTNLKAFERARAEQLQEVVKDLSNDIRAKRDQAGTGTLKSNLQMRVGAERLEVEMSLSKSGASAMVFTSKDVQTLENLKTHKSDIETALADQFGYQFDKESLVFKPIGSALNNFESGFEDFHNLDAVKAGDSSQANRTINEILGGF